MNDSTALIRTEATRALLQRVDAVLSQWRKLPFNDALTASILEQTCQDVDRARRQFDSKLFFVVVFGPLKAGKSTLTNALAGEYVSPAGFGRETTRRPSLVVQGAEGHTGASLSRSPKRVCHNRLGLMGFRLGDKERQRCAIDDDSTAEIEFSALCKTDATVNSQQEIGDWRR
jgi:hypothetical protein